MKGNTSLVKVTGLVTQLCWWCVQSVSRIRLFANAWTVACHASLSMAFSRQEYCSGLPCPPSGHLPDPVIEPRSPTLQADS